jgi:hypothetical protein
MVPSSWMVRRVALVITDVSEERIGSIIRVTRIGEIGTTLSVTSNRSTMRRNTADLVSNSSILVTLIIETLHSFDTSILSRTTQRHHI